jgi:DNA invertase Pin-like site-specific DNA recombinase
MSIYGYARVSSADQDLTVQREALKAAGCEVIREEKVSGGSREGRQELEMLLSFLRPGDTLIVTKLDRLARSTLDMLLLITELGNRGVGVRSLAERDIDTTTAAGKLMLTVFAAVAQFERERIKERQVEGIKRARDNREVSERTGRLKYAGGKPRIDRAEVTRLKTEGLNPTQIATKLGINRVTVYRLTSELEGKAA